VVRQARPLEGRPLHQGRLRLMDWRWVVISLIALGVLLLGFSQG
jgi:hypothetical protein